VRGYGPITIVEGVTGSNTAAYGDVGRILSENVAQGENILLSASLYSAVVFQSGLPMQSFMTEGDSSAWSNALSQPQDYADWVVMGNQNPNDAVYVALLQNNAKAFLDYYKNFYCNAEICIYEKRTPAEMFLYADGTSLRAGSENFIVKGVNDYDLAYKSNQQIDATLKNLSGIGVNTIRFWLFGDGNSDGFQPQTGVMNETRFESADYLIADAANYDIRLIPVLVNNWTDYGGEQQYLIWTGKNPGNQDQFYTDPETIALFENYINHVIPRKNTITGVSYDNDPTIMAWEIVNEPRFSNADSQAFVNWFSAVAGYIRQDDPNHMITLETDTTSVGQNGSLDVSDYCSRLLVNLCSAHLYLYNNNRAIYPNLNTVNENVQRYIQIADADNKPFILGEVGVSKNTPSFGQTPLTMLKDIMDNNGSSGALIWNWSDVPDASYGFSPKGTNGVYTLADLSNVLGGIAPSTVYLAPGGVSGGGYDISTPDTEPISTAPPQGLATNAENFAPAPEIPVMITATSSAAKKPPSAVPTTTLANPTTIAVPAPLPASTNLSLPYATSYFRDADWGDGWGGAGIANGVLTVGSNASSTSGGIFLDGSGSWQNYLVKANIDWVKGDLVTVIARRSDSNDYLECVFSSSTNDSEHIDMDRVFNNQTTAMGAEGTILNEFDKVAMQNMTISMQVSGNHVACGINNAYTTNNIDVGLQPILLTGGIGFTAWDPTKNNSEIIVNSVSVVPLY